MTSIKFVAQDEAFLTAKANHLAIIGISENFNSLKEIKLLDKEMDGRLSTALSQAKFKASSNLSMIAATKGISQLTVSDCTPVKGSKAEKDRYTLRVDVEKACAVAVQGFEKSGLSDADGVAHIWLAGEAGCFGAQAALGASLSLYRFDKYRKVEGAYHIKEVILHVPSDRLQKAESCWKEISPVEAGIRMARDLVNEPSNYLYPEEYTKRIKELEKFGIEVEILDEKKMKELGFGALLGVAQGSVHKPYVAVMQYKGGKGDPIVFIGKGVTFDSGGISLKPAAGMDEMKADMGGSAAVVGTMLSLAARKAKVNAVGVVGLVENMPSATAQRPGDIVKAYDGQTIEVLNTDAEGRLVLADVLSYAAKRFNPKWMIDLATLTGAMVVALGEQKAGLFASDDVLADLLFNAGEQTGDYLWKLPMGQEYADELKSSIADVKNIGGRAGGSILAAEFLKRFTNNVAWAHLDIAGTAYRTKGRPLTPKGATGFGVRLLDKFVRTYEKTAS